MRMALCILSSLVLMPLSIVESSAQSPKLTQEQTHIVKEIVKDLKIEPVTLSKSLSPGDGLPEGTMARPMPAEIGQRVLQIKSHFLLVSTQQILIIDPKDAIVSEAIEQ
jgi:hypothetical protein